MTQQRPFGADWWTDGGGSSLRVAAGVLLSPLILSAVATLLGFLVSGSTLATGEEVQARTITIALTAVSSLFGFAISFGLLAFLGLWLFRKRSRTAFAAAGLAAGLLFGIVATALGGGVNLGVSVGFAVTGALQLLLARWLAKVRPAAPAVQ